jgi:UDP-2,3-diacylglucosamine pyrophosphatase LpxH
MNLALDELYCVSDLHLGGEPGFQIFRQGAELAAMIDAVRARPANRRVGLVLNGDIVDFLAETPARYLDPAGAVAKLDRVISDPAFTPVFDALRDFVRTANRFLTLALGNHDVELALPTSLARLEAFLCDDSVDARGRLTFAMDGSGFRCRVGDRTVLCLHGNEFDSWNVVDREQLLDTSRALLRGQPPPEWSPNAGTKLVIDVMNDLKARYRWVDLLKPEIQAVLPVLLAIEPSCLAKLRHGASILARKVRDSWKMAGFLGLEGEEPEAPDDPDAALLSLLGDGEIGEHLGLGRASDGWEMMCEVDALFLASLEDPASRRIGLDLVEGGDEMLGLWGDLLDRLRAAGPEALRLALKRLGVSADEAVDEPDDLFETVERRIAGHVDFVVTGHTHSPKWIGRAGGGTYFNCGSWIDLIRIPEDVLEDSKRFQRVFHAFQDGSIDAIDALAGEGLPVLQRRPTVVRVVRSRSRVEGDLCRFQAGQDPPFAPLAPQETAP